MRNIVAGGGDYDVVVEDEVLLRAVVEDLDVGNSAIQIDPEIVEPKLTDAAVAAAGGPRV